MKSTVVSIFILLIFNVSCSLNEEMKSFSYTSSIQPQNGGSVTPSKGVFPEGTDLEITAVPNEGFVFKNWAGASIDSTNSIILTIDSDKQLTAIFDKADSDGDRVSDDMDACSDTAEGEIVDSEGCSGMQRDTDNDGVPDDLDICSNTLEGEIVNENGCSISQVDSDNDGVLNDVDQCNDTPDGEAVNANGCSQSQLDIFAPQVTQFRVIEITSTTFTVDWNLDENSKGYIRFGTSSGVYEWSTGIESNFLERHVQTVGDNNPLKPGTTYFWQIFVEDELGNTEFSGEQSTTTLMEVSKTYVPDDQFERILIYLGYDDIMDDYVLTENIENVLTLKLSSTNLSDFPWQSRYENPIHDFTGLQSFVSLEEIVFDGLNELTGDNIDLSKNSKLKSVTFQCTSIRNINLSENTLLEELRFRGGVIGENCRGTIENLDLSSNPNLKILWMVAVNAYDDLNLLISKAKFIEELTLGGTPGYSELNLSNNYNLRKLSLSGDPMTLEYVNLKNGSNEKLESIVINPLISGVSNICIEVDLPDHVQTIISDAPLHGLEINITDQCPN